MENQNWGVNNTQLPPKADDTQNNIDDIYHMGYARTLKSLGNIIIYGLPILIAFLVYLPLSEAIDDIAVIIAIAVYAILAFVLWITVSYVVNLFDNVAKIAQSTDTIARTKNREKDV